MTIVADQQQDNAIISLRCRFGDRPTSPDRRISQCVFVDVLGPYQLPFSYIPATLAFRLYSIDLSCVDVNKDLAVFCSWVLRCRFLHPIVPLVGHVGIIEGKS